MTLARYSRLGERYRVNQASDEALSYVLDVKAAVTRHGVLGTR
jgi:hypothetical protein